MEMFGKTLCVTYDELVGSGIMSKSNYKKHVREKKFVLLQKGGNGRKVRIVYESMPETIRANYDAKYPDAKKQLKKQIVPMNERLKGDEKAANFFRTYTPKIMIERQTEYMLNVKVLNAMVAKEMDLKGILILCSWNWSWENSLLLTFLGKWFNTMWFRFSFFFEQPIIYFIH